MWMIRQFNILAEILRAELGSIRESIQQQIGSIRTAYEAERETRDQIPARLAELRISENEKCEERRHRKKDYTVQVILAIGTCGAFLAATIYAGIAAHQATIMNETLGEVRKQAEVAQNTFNLMRTETLGHQGAVLKLHIEMVGVNNEDDIPSVSYSVNNLPGRVDAKNIAVDLTYKVISLPSMKPSSNPIRCPPLSALQLPGVSDADTPEGSRPITGDFYGLGVRCQEITRETLDEVKALRQSIEVSGSFAYDNGFGVIVKTDVCQRTIYFKQGTQFTGGFVDCYEFDRALKRALGLNAKADAAGK